MIKRCVRKREENQTKDAYKLTDFKPMNLYLQASYFLYHRMWFYLKYQNMATALTFLPQL